jgi:hypothetical protein
MHKSIFPALVVAATVSLSFAQDPNLHIYLAYGQSNMSGQADVTAADRAEDPRFLVLRAATIRIKRLESLPCCTANGA